jgi:hypothetical protein
MALVVLIHQSVVTLLKTIRGQDIDEPEGTHGPDSSFGWWPLAIAHLHGVI